MQISQELIIFSHIPKTAGSSINEMLEQNYSQIFELYIKRNQNETNVKDWINSFNQSVAKSENTNNIETRLLRGHFGLGIHEFLKYKSCTYITILRHPVDRVISHYYYFKRPESSSKLIKDDMSLEDFIRQRKYTITDNLQTRFLSGLGWQKTTIGKDLYDKKFSLKYGNCTDEMLSFAKDNLNKYVIFGLQNRFAESLDLFKNILGWKNISYDTEKNVNTKRPKKDLIDIELTKLIEKENSLDLQLYNYAQEIFENQLVDLPSQSKILSSTSSWSYPSIPVTKKRVKITQNIQQNTQERSSLMPPVQLQEAYQVQMKEAEEFFKAEQYSEAANKYIQIIDSNPEYIPALSKLAKSYEKMQASDKAIATYEKILSLKPNKAKTQAKMGKLMEKQGNSDAAIAAYKKAIALNAEQPDWVYTGLGTLLKKSKKAARQ